MDRDEALKQLRIHLQRAHDQMVRYGNKHRRVLLDDPEGSIVRYLNQDHRGVIILIGSREFMLGRKRINC